MKILAKKTNHFSVNDFYKPCALKQTETKGSIKLSDVGSDA